MGANSQPLIGWFASSFSHNWGSLKSAYASVRHSGPVMDSSHLPPGETPVSQFPTSSVSVQLCSVRGCHYHELAADVPQGSICFPPLQAFPRLIPDSRLITIVESVIPACRDPATGHHHVGCTCRVI